MCSNIRVQYLLTRILESVSVGVRSDELERKAYIILVYTSRYVMPLPPTSFHFHRSLPVKQQGAQKKLSAEAFWSLEVIP